jgi:16S rRNA (cytidine1402-2'-O)-methyltransferase
LPGTLYVVATPIGNLGDHSVRMRQVLEGCEGIFCEDTRVTENLFRALKIESKSPQKPFYRLDEALLHTDRIDQAVKTLEELGSGRSYAYVSDAGTPGIQDPGALLVRALHERGYPVVAIPGPSALSSFVSISGLLGQTLVFRGYFPRENRDRLLELDSLGKIGFKGKCAVVWFESPHRILGTLEMIASRFAENTLCVSKELTKVFEQTWFGVSSQVYEKVQKHLLQEGERGEWVLGIELDLEKNQNQESEKRAYGIKALTAMLQEKIPLKTAVKVISQSFGISKNELYEIGLKLKNSHGGD